MDCKNCLILNKNSKNKIKLFFSPNDVIKDLFPHYEMKTNNNLYHLKLKKEKN